MDSNKCMSRKNIFADFNSSINIFDISKTLTHQQKFFFELLHVEQSTKIISLRIIYYADKKLILKSKQKIDHSNSFHKNRYNLVNRIQKAIGATFTQSNTAKRKRKLSLKKVVIMKFT
jgi:hypothetical protein